MKCSKFVTFFIPIMNNIVENITMCYHKLHISVTGKCLHFAAVIRHVHTRAESGSNRVYTTVCCEANPYQIPSESGLVLIGIYELVMWFTIGVKWRCLAMLSRFQPIFYLEKVRRRLAAVISFVLKVMRCLVGPVPKLPLSLDCGETRAYKKSFVDQQR